MRRTPIRSVSRKRAAENRQRAKVLAPLREAQPWCSRCGVTGQGLDGHELVRRSQEAGAALNPDVIVLVCRDCHRWIGDNPTAAHDEGWVVYGWERRQGIA